MLNEVTKPDKYPLPRINDLLDSISGKALFSKLDLKKAYHQIPVDEQDRPKTAVITPFGLYEYVKMPFGLRNAAQTFQRHMDNVLTDMRDHCLWYIDDVLIFSNNAEDHHEHVKNVLSTLKKAGLEINKEKCVFERNKIDFLGFQITSEGVKPSESRADAILNLNTPRNIKELRRFIGTIGYYHWLIPNLSELLAPLHDLITEANKVEKEFTWGEIHEKALKKRNKNWHQ